MLLATLAMHPKEAYPRTVEHLDEVLRGFYTRFLRVRACFRLFCISLALFRS